MEATKRPVGRPSEYLPEYCEAVVELGKLGFSHAMIASEIGVDRQTLRNWAAVHPEFLGAITHARDEAQAWFERKGMIGLETNGFNASLWAKQVSCRFPDDYTDKTKQEVSGNSSLEIRFVDS